MASQTFFRSRGNRNTTTSCKLAVCTFVVVFAIAALYTRSASKRDPGSWFFDPHNAYEPRYSTLRRQQAEACITAADKKPPLHRSEASGSVPRLCVGIPSIARAGVRYLRTTVGSLLEGLAAEERNSIHMIVFIPHSDPELHPAYHEHWLATLTDEILGYNVSKEQMEHIVTMEREDELFREKGLYDYTYLLKACHKTGSPYIAMFEDDVIALDGWYHRTIAALAKAETMFPRTLDTIPGFLYLRLFYTEQFLGWNSEDWPLYTFWSLTSIAIVALILYLIRSQSSYAERHLAPRGIITICVIALPSLILLMLAAGKNTVFPLPNGVNIMNKYGCCSQGLVFPRQKAQDLIQWYEQARVGFVDMLTEQYADEHRETRLALVPAVIQHVGRKSSKGGDGSSVDSGSNELSVTEKLWNFRFEEFDRDTLMEEHVAVNLDN